MATRVVAPSMVGTWNVDVMHSSVEFAIRHMGVCTFRAPLRSFSATFVADDDGLALLASGRVSDIDWRDAGLAGALLAPAYFDGDRHPELELVTRSLELDECAVSGLADLTMKGQTHAVAVTGTVSGPVDDPFGGVRLGLELGTTVDRRAFGIDGNLPLPGGGFALANEVRISAALELLRAA
jgi:polyisoprenoid-binding protein YceI